MMIESSIASCLLCGMVLFFVTGVADAGELITKSQSHWKIVLPAMPDATEDYAALELQSVILKMSGALLPITNGGETRGGGCIILGTPQSNSEVRDSVADLNLNDGSPQKVAVYTIDGNLYLAGNSPRAVLYSVYTFLQDAMGVQWLWPGEDGEFIPKRTHFTLPQLAINKTPAFQYRGFHLVFQHANEDYETWMTRNFINIMRSDPEHKPLLTDRRKKGLHVMFSSHNATLPNEVFERHPEYFALVSGKRVPWQLCLSNPDAEEGVVDKVKVWLEDNPGLEILSMFPSDNTQYCECDKCSSVSLSTNWFDFFKRVCDAVKPGYPDLKFASIAYQGYLELPETDLSWVEFIEYCQYDHCYIHQYSDDCDLNDISLKAIGNWSQKGIPLGIYAYDFYIFTLHTAENIYIPLYSRVPDQIRRMKELNVKLVIPEAPLHNATGDREASKQNRLGMYLYAQLMWDPSQSLDGLLDRWNERVFGDLAGDMRPVQDEMMRMWDDAEMHLTHYSHYAPDVVREMITPERIATIADLFCTAKASLGSVEDVRERNRVAGNIEWEEVLFDQWVEAYWATAAPLQYMINLKKAQGESASFSSMSEVEGVSETGIAMNWSDVALNFRVTFRGGEEPSAGLSDKIRLRIKNIKDYKSSYRQVTLGADGACESLMVPVGAEDSIEWKAQFKTSVKSTPAGHVVELSIPFEKDFPRPKEFETWLFSVKRILSVENDRASYPSGLEANASSFANLHFGGERDVDKRLLMLLPNQVTIDESTLLMRELTRDGWDYRFTLDPEVLEEDLDSYDVICFYTPQDSLFDSEKIGLVARDLLRRGKVVFFSGYGDLMLDEYFNDSSCGMIGSGWDIHSMPVQSVSGSWNTAPNNLLGIMKESAPPVWGYAPIHPKYWTELATLQTPNDATFPCLIARRYEGGLLVVGGGNVGTGGGWALFGNLRPDSVRMLFNNLLEYNLNESN